MRSWGTLGIPGRAWGSLDESLRGDLRGALGGLGGSWGILGAPGRSLGGSWGLRGEPGEALWRLLGLQGFSELLGAFQGLSKSSKASKASKSSIKAYRLQSFKQIKKSKQRLTGFRSCVHPWVRVCKGSKASHMHKQIRKQMQYRYQSQVAVKQTYAICN